jgi:GxxExxY protein
MNTDGETDLKFAGNSKLFFKDETERILYENSLAVAFRLEGIPFDQQRRFPVLFKGQQVGEFVPDLLVFDAIIADPKVIERITDHERGQMINYLRIAKKRVGLILNFKYARLQWERIVL